MDCLGALVSPPSPAPHPNALIALLGLDHRFGQKCVARHPGLTVSQHSSTTVAPSQISRQPYYIPHSSIPRNLPTPRPHCSVESLGRLHVSCRDDSGVSTPSGTSSRPDYESTVVPVLPDKRKSVQPEEKSPFRCPDCNKVYARRGRLYEHRRSIHKYRPKCEYCLDEFTFVRELKKHVRLKHSLEYYEVLMMKDPRMM